MQFLSRHRWSISCRIEVGYTSYTVAAFLHLQVGPFCKVTADPLYVGIRYCNNHLDSAVSTTDRMEDTFFITILFVNYVRDRIESGFFTGHCPRNVKVRAGIVLKTSPAMHNPRNQEKEVKTRQTAYKKHFSKALLTVHQEGI